MQCDIGCPTRYKTFYALVPHHMQLVPFLNFSLLALRQPESATVYDSHKLKKKRLKWQSLFHEPMCSEHDSNVMPHLPHLLSMITSFSCLHLWFTNHREHQMNHIVNLFQNVAFGRNTATPISKFICSPPLSHIIFVSDHLDKLRSSSMTPIIKVSCRTSCPFGSSASFLFPAVDLPSFLVSRDVCCHQTYAKCVICVISWSSQSNASSCVVTCCDCKLCLSWCCQCKTSSSELHMAWQSSVLWSYYLFFILFFNLMILVI